MLVGIGEFTTHFRTYFGDWQVHWYGILSHGHFLSYWTEEFLKSIDFSRPISTQVRPPDPNALTRGALAIPSN